MHIFPIKEERRSITQRPLRKPKWLSAINLFFSETSRGEFLTYFLQVYKAQKTKNRYDGGRGIGFWNSDDMKVGSSFWDDAVDGRYQEKIKDGQKDV